MKLTNKNSSIDFIIKKWDVQNCISTENINFNPFFKNGSTVALAKNENYNWRYVFVRNVDKYVSVCKDLQMHCINGNFYLYLILIVTCLPIYYY